MQANINVIKGRHLIGKQENEENRRTAYQYDSYYRLRRVDYDCAYSSSDPTCANNRNNVFKCNSSETDCEDFQLDGVHNIRASRENQIDVSWTVDGFNRLTQKSDGSNTVKYTYDSNNNMTGEDLDGDQNADIVYTYDKLNRLIEVKDGSQNTIAEYTYDAFNRRITKTVGITTERFSYDDWNIVEISINSDLYTNIIDSSTDRHIAIEVTANNTSTLYYFLTDERGNVTALTDANGNILERYRYRVYGDFEILDAQFTPKNCNNQTCYATNLHNFLWGGSLYEPETNLYWMRNRYYHIDMHRFINQDPIGIWGDANNLGNGFAYVAGMVIEASDPSGLELTSKSSLGKKIIEYGCESSATFAKLARESNDRLIITTNDLTEKYGGAYNDPKNKKIVLSLEIAKNGIEADITDDEDRKKENEKATTKYLSPQAAAAHEMAEAAFKRGNANKEEYKNNPDKLNKDAHLEGIATEDKVLDEQKEYEEKRKKEEEVLKKENEEKEKKDKGGEKYPSDPDNSNDSYQQKLMESMLAKILRNSDFSIYEQGPVVKIQVETSGNPKWVFVFNPFYRGKDPMKQIFWNIRNADGTNGFVRNPFAPGAEYGYNSTTYEKFQQAGFPQTNVDPYFN